MRYQGTYGTRFLRMAASALVILGLVMTFGAGGALAQDETGLVSDTQYNLMYGGVLTWDEPWSVDEDQSGFDKEILGDYVVLDNGTALISFFTTPAVGSTPDTAERQISFINYNFDGAELVDMEITKHHGHGIVRFTYLTTPYAAYVDLTETSDYSTLLTTIVMAPMDGFGAVLNSIERVIELDGEPLLQDVDPARAQGLLENGEPMPFPVDKSEFEEDSGAPDKNQEKKLPDEDAATPPATPEEQERGRADGRDEEPTETPVQSDLSKLGLVDDSTWQSPQFDTQVTWGNEWSVDESLLASDEDAGVDRLALVSEDRDATFYFSVYAADEVTPDAWMDDLLDSLDDQDAAVTVLDRDSDNGVEKLFYRSEENGEEQYGIIEAREIEAEGVTVVVELLGSAEDDAAAFRSIQRDVEVAGDPPFQSFERFPRIESSALPQNRTVAGRR